jgi:hypothetical protein
VGLSAFRGRGLVTFGNSPSGRHPGIASNPWPIDRDTADFWRKARFVKPQSHAPTELESHKFPSVTFYTPGRERHHARLICIEGWSEIGQWSGVLLRSFLERIGADLRSRYLGFKCADRITGASTWRARCTRRQFWHFDYGNAPLPLKYGYPMRLRDGRSVQLLANGGRPGTLAAINLAMSQQEPAEVLLCLAQDARRCGLRTDKIAHGFVCRIRHPNCGQFSGPV